MLLQNFLKGKKILKKRTLKELNRKQKKIWANNYSEFYNGSMKSWLQNDNIEIYLKDNQVKSVVVEQFIRILKNKISKYMTAIQKRLHTYIISKLVHKYNNTTHSSRQMKPIDVKPNTYIGLEVDINTRKKKFRVRDHLRISKYKKVFTKVSQQDWKKRKFCD